MTDISPFPKYDFSRFVWQLPKGGSKRAVRSACGGEVMEDFLNRYCMGEQNLFFGLYADLAVPVPEARLVAAAKESWAWLRFHVPTIASTAEKDEHDNTILAYNIATEEDVQDWIDRTFCVTKQSTVDLDQLRYEVGTDKIPSDAGDQTFLHFVPGRASTDGSVLSFGLLFHTNHIVIDGSGVKALFHRYLSHLSSILYLPNKDVQPKLPWGTEATNLLPTPYQIMLSSEPEPVSTGSLKQPPAEHPYYSTLREFMEGLTSGAQVIEYCLFIFHYRLIA